MAEIARAGIAKPAEQPAQAIRHSVFRRLLNSGNAVSGSAGLAPNAADGIAQYSVCLACDCQSQPLAVYGNFVMYDKQNRDITLSYLV